MSDPADRINLCRCGGDPEPLSDLCRPCANELYLDEGEAEYRTVPANTGGDPFAPEETEHPDDVFRTTGVDLFRRFNDRWHNYGKGESA